MNTKELELTWLVRSEHDFDREESGLDEHELERLSFYAEHPELADPLIWFLPNFKERATFSA